VLGIDVGGTSIRAGLFVPRSGSIRHVRAIRTDASRGGRHAWRAQRPSHERSWTPGSKLGLSVHKVGIGVPELVGSGGEIESRAVLPWRSTRVRKAFAAYGDVIIASDVRAAALAEARLGAARGNPTFLYVGVGTGISSTLFIDGRLISERMDTPSRSQAARPAPPGLVTAKRFSLRSNPARQARHWSAVRKRWAITPRTRRRFVARHASNPASRAEWSTPQRPNSRRM
jgi:hypothetical protein